ncbi:MAG: DUF1761 domain-containing protein [Hellea sp.]
MPKIFGTNLLGILAAGIVFWLLGWIWYGMVFSEMWHALTEIPKPTEEVMDPKIMIGGILASIAMALGLAYILQHSSASRLGTCAKISAIVSLLIGMPLMAMDNLYQGEPLKLLALDYSYVLVGFAVMGVILSFFRGKDAIEIGEG